MVRKAVEGDFSGVHEVFVEVHKFHLENRPGIFKDIDPLTLEDFKDILEEEGKIFLVSDNDGIDGFLDATIVEKTSKSTGFKRFLFIDHLGVLKSSQKSGVGRKLMEEAEKFAKEKECTIMVLDVWGFNDNAIGFYEHLGFEERTRKCKSLYKMLRSVSMKAIEVKGLSKTFKSKVKEKGLKGSIKSIFKSKYNDKKAVNNIDFSVEKGEVLAFIGPNGAGKSTTIKMLTGILYPTSGEVSVMGINPQKQRKELAYKIGTVFGQKEQLWIHLTPYDNFKFFGAIYDIPDAVVEKRIEEYKNIFELDAFMNTPVRGLSLGQRMICEIVASLIHEPEILFLDEPTIGLDPVVKEKIRVFIKRLNKEKKTTIFLTSHDVGDIEKLCKRVIIVNDGEIVLDDTMENLKYHYLNKKIVEAKMNTKINLDDVDGITILKDKDYNLKLEVDLTKKSISDAIKLLDPDKIIDINISNTPLETIISSIYKGTKK